MAKEFKATISGSKDVSTTDKKNYEAKFEGGNPPYTIAWYIDGQKANFPKDCTSITMDWSKVTPGQHTFEVVITDSKGASVRTRQTVELKADKFSAEASGPTTARVGERAQYIVTVKGGVPPYRYEWFINGVRQTGVQDPGMVVTWAQAGTHNLGISVFDSKGASKQIADTITVTDNATQPPAQTGSSSGFSGTYNGRIKTDRDNKFCHKLVLSVSGSKFSGTFSKNPEAYYGIKAYGEFSGDVAEVRSPMARNMVIKDCMGITGTLSGVYETGKESSPFKGEFSGSLNSDGTASGVCRFYGPPWKAITGRSYSQYEWKASKNCPGVFGKEEISEHLKLREQRHPAVPSQRSAGSRNRH